MSKFTKSVAVVVASGVLGLGTASIAQAATTPEVPVVAIENQEQVAAALREIVTVENIDALLAQVNDAATVQELTVARAELVSAKQNRDIYYDLFLILWKVGKPVIVALLRHGGPLIGKLVGVIPDLLAGIPIAGVIAGPITAAVLKPVGELIATGLPALADLIEQINIDGVSQAEGEQRIVAHLASTGLPAESAAVFGKALGLLVG
nr:hypothetical protein [Kibdelosporangium sp. MJ126-NF4]CTQ89007.1 hypothetical protein [Kibdelosporangium sp. MJ126-NF4]